MGLEHGLDLGGRDVLAAADDRVGLAPGDAQPAVLVEAAQIAGVQPAVGGERRRRDGRPAHQDLPSAAMRTRVQNSGGPALAALARRSPRAGVVVTCEQASVSP